MHHKGICRPIRPIRTYASHDATSLLLFSHRSSTPMIKSNVLTVELDNKINPGEGSLHGLFCYGPFQVLLRCTAWKHVCLTKTNSNNDGVRLRVLTSYYTKMYYIDYDTNTYYYTRTTCTMRRDWNTENKPGLAHAQLCNLPQTIAVFSLLVKIVTDTICDIYIGHYFLIAIFFRYDIGIGITI